MPVFSVQAASAEYPVVVDRGVVSQLSRFLPQKCGKVFLITEKPLWDLLGSNFAQFAENVLFLPGGEEMKRIAHVEALAETLVEQGADRHTVLIAVGGGIVTDMAGFLAAIFMRGISVLQVPTTLLAQVDAAVGGKTGVNLRAGKNLLGSFHQPHAVVVDPSLLDTLPEREFRAGLYEIIKCGVIASPNLFELLRDERSQILARTPDLLDQLIAESVRIKAEVVSTDERESGLRRILNFGHTLGHAIEAETAYARYLHGEAVALGMKMATLLAFYRGTLRLPACTAIIRVVESYGPVPSASDLPLESLFARLARDKKTKHGQVHFVLPTEIGKTEIVTDLPDSLVRRAIAEALT